MLMARAELSCELASACGTHSGQVRVATKGGDASISTVHAGALSSVRHPSPSPKTAVCSLTIVRKTSPP
jgi:hypothetical protein